MNSFLIAPFLVAFGGPAVALGVIAIARLTGPGLSPVDEPGRQPATATPRPATARPITGTKPGGRLLPVPPLARTELSNG